MIYLKNKPIRITERNRNDFIIDGKQIVGVYCKELSKFINADDYIKNGCKKSNLKKPFSNIKLRKLKTSDLINFKLDPIYDSYLDFFIKNLDKNKFLKFLVKNLTIDKNLFLLYATSHDFSKLNAFDFLKTVNEFFYNEPLYYKKVLKSTKSSFIEYAKTYIKKDFINNLLLIKESFIPRHINVFKNYINLHFKEPSYFSLYNIFLNLKIKKEVYQLNTQKENYNYEKLLKITTSPIVEKILLYNRKFKYSLNDLYNLAVLLNKRVIKQDDLFLFMKNKYYYFSVKNVKKDLEKRLRKRLNAYINNNDMESSTSFVEKIIMYNRDLNYTSNELIRVLNLYSVKIFIELELEWFLYNNKDMINFDVQITTHKNFNIALKSLLLYVKNNNLTFTEEQLKIILYYNSTVFKNNINNIKRFLKKYNNKITTKKQTEYIKNNMLTFFSSMKQKFNISKLDKGIINKLNLDFNYNQQEIENIYYLFIIGVANKDNVEFIMKNKYIYFKMFSREFHKATNLDNLKKMREIAKNNNIDEKIANKLNIYNREFKFNLSKIKFIFNLYRLGFFKENDMLTFIENNIAFINFDIKNPKYRKKEIIKNYLLKNIDLSEKEIDIVILLNYTMFFYDSNTLVNIIKKQQPFNKLDLINSIKTKLKIILK